MTDYMHSFDLFEPASVEEAAQLAEKYGKDGWIIAGGKDSFDWFKDRIKRPAAVVDLVNLDSLRGIRSTDDGIEIGALTTITDVVMHPELALNYSVLTDAASGVATPQIRNRGTLGGNLSQDTRCWYYRGGWPCYRAGGNTCYASGPTAMNREHCIMGSSRCVAVNPSDLAPALIALDAEFVIQGPRGTRFVDAEDFFMRPSIDIERMTILKPAELLTKVRLPLRWAGSRFYFEKIEDRKAGLRLITSPWKRPAPDTAPFEAKASGPYIICTMSKEYAEKNGYHDALMLDYRGYVAEGTGANIFFIKGNDIHTPIPDCFLNGITRQTVIEMATNQGFKIIERHIQPDEINNYDEAFLTGTAAEITPIRSIDNINFKTGDNSTTYKFMQDFSNLVNNTN